MKKNMITGAGRYAVLIVILSTRAIKVDNDTYRLITNDIEIDGYIGFYDKKDGSATGKNLEDGTYEVPITILNEVDSSATSMAAS